MTKFNPFETLGSAWWDPHGPLRTLHHINPCRLHYTAQRVHLSGQRVLDVGCGGGVFSEALSQQGAHVTGLDISEAAIQAARAHAAASQLSISYHQATLEEWIATDPEPFPVIVCYEMLEHVDDPAKIIQQLSQLLAPGGTLCVSTLNRTLATFVQAIVGAEYLLKLIPAGTHHIRQCIQPAELLAYGRAAGLQIRDITGMRYNPFTHTAQLTDSLRINYFVCWDKK